MEEKKVRRLQATQTATWPELSGSEVPTSCIADHWKRKEGRGIVVLHQEQIRLETKIEEHCVSLRSMMQE